MNSAATPGDHARTAAVFRALSDPGRLQILHLLAWPPATACAAPGGVCNCDLTELLGLSQPTVSHHMRLLVQAGLVTATKRGKWTDYHLNREGLTRAANVLEALQTALPAS